MESFELELAAAADYTYNRFVLQEVQYERSIFKIAELLKKHKR